MLALLHPESNLHCISFLPLDFSLPHHLMLSSHGPDFTCRVSPRSLALLVPRLSLCERCFCLALSCYRCHFCHGLNVLMSLCAFPPVTFFEKSALCVVEPMLGLGVSCRMCISLSSAGGRVKTWKRRWFILTDNCLYYFEYTTVSTQGWARTCF